MRSLEELNKLTPVQAFDLGWYAAMDKVHQQQDEVQARCSGCTAIPSEPPVGTIVRDRHGALHKRYDDGWGEPYPGFYHLGKWAAMWERRGPLEIASIEQDGD